MVGPSVQQINLVFGVLLGLCGLLYLYGKAREKEKENLFWFVCLSLLAVFEFTFGISVLIT